ARSSTARRPGAARSVCSSSLIGYPPARLAYYGACRPPRAASSPAPARSRCGTIRAPRAWRGAAAGCGSCSTAASSRRPRARSACWSRANPPPTTSPPRPSASRRSPRPYAARVPRPSRLLTAALPLALLASTATARRPHTPHTLKLRFPRLSIPARTNPEACVLVRVATTAPFDLASIEIRLRGVRGSFAVQHFLVHLYTGERLGEFGAERGRAVPSRGCLDLGPSDRDRRQLVASGTLTRSPSAF